MAHSTSLSSAFSKKVLFVFSLISIFCTGISAQILAPKWAVDGNVASNSDFLGTTNNEDLTFKTNNVTALKIKANGNIILKSLEGSGSGLLTIDNSGKAINLPFTGNANQMLLGNGTFGTLPGILWSDAGSGKIYYNGGKVGIGTATPNFKLDVDGDVRITQNLYLQGGLVISDKIETPKQMKAKAIEADSIKMDSTKAVYGVATFKDDVRLSTKLTVSGAATISGPLKLSGGVSFGTPPPVSVDPCIEMLLMNSSGTMVTMDIATDLAFDPETAPCGEAPLIPFTWQTWGNHVNSDKRWIGTYENYDFNIKTNNTLRMVVKKDGSVGIGTDLTDNPFGYKLAVNGMIGAKEVKIEVNSTTWPDFVFEADYKRMTILEKEAYYLKEKHLPYIDSRKDLGENGLKMGTVLSGMTQNIEENTMDIVALYKKILELEQQNRDLKKQVEGLSK